MFVSERLDWIARKAQKAADRNSNASVVMVKPNSILHCALLAIQRGFCALSKRFRRRCAKAQNCIAILWCVCARIGQCNKVHQKRAKPTSKHTHTHRIRFRFRFRICTHRKSTNSNIAATCAAAAAAAHKSFATLLPFGLKLLFASSSSSNANCRIQRLSRWANGI